MKRCSVIVLVCLILLVSVSSVLAQTGVKIDSMQINIFPEYDREAVLVIYRINMPPNQSLPVELTFQLPQGVNKPYNIAMEDVDGLLYNLDYEITPGNIGNMVTFTTLTQNIQIEYYDESLRKTDNNQKEFAYQWSGDYSVDHMNILLQEPATATRFQVIPDIGSTISGDDHLEYYAMEVGEVKAGTNFTVRLRYEKNDDVLSINAQSVQPVQPIPQSEILEVSVQNENLFPVMMGFFGILIIVAGSIWYHKTGQAKKEPGNSRQRTQSREGNSGSEELIPIYCHRCGKKAKTGDLFCRACGSKLRL